MAEENCLCTCSGSGGRACGCARAAAAVVLQSAECLEQESKNALQTWKYAVWSNPTYRTATTQARHACWKTGPAPHKQTLLRVGRSSKDSTDRTVSTWVQDGPVLCPGLHPECFRGSGASPACILLQHPVFQPGSFGRCQKEEVSMLPPSTHHQYIARLT